MKKLFLQYGKLMCGEFLEEPCDKEVYTHQKAVWDKMVSEYNAAVSAARDSAVEADPGHGFYKALLNAEGFSTGEGSDHEVNVAMSFLKEGQLYDLPEGWMVEIEYQHKAFDTWETVDEKRYNQLCIIRAGVNRKIARLIPLKEQSSGIAAIGVPEYGPLAEEYIGTWMIEETDIPHPHHSAPTIAVFKEAGIPESGEKPEMSPEDKGFAQCLREEFLINTQNYPKEYHALFAEKFKRAEENFKKFPKHYSVSPPPQAESRHKYEPEPEHPQFCRQCGYAEHVKLKHF